MQDGDNALLEIAIHFCQSERRSGDKIACPSSAGAVNVGDATPGLRAAFRKLLLGGDATPGLHAAFRKLLLGGMLRPACTRHSENCYSGPRCCIMRGHSLSCVECGWMLIRCLGGGRLRASL